MENKSLQERIEEQKAKGKSEHEITYGMLCDGFQPIPGIPDNFCSAEDSDVRVKLWREQQLEQEGDWRDKYMYRPYGCGNPDCPGCD